MKNIKLTTFILALSLSSTAFATGGKQGPPAEKTDVTVIEQILIVLGL